jgi:hypothetical protein
MYWSSLPNYLAALLGTPTIDSYWSIVLAPIYFYNFIKAYLRTTEKRKHFSAALEYVFPVHRNLLESRRGHSGTSV